MERLDIVYILKDGIVPDELTYSLRSVDQNFPHRKVWFVGAQPEGLYPDGHIVHTQVGYSKWERVRSSLLEVIRNEDITEDFYLFNDDFFVMKPVRNFIDFTDGSLDRRIRELTSRVGQSSYTRLLKRAREELTIEGCDIMSFAVHAPMKLNRHKLELIVTKYEGLGFRSMYGNIYRIPYIYHEDVKIYNNDIEPSADMDFISTSDGSFKDGKVGEYIRERFVKPSRFERGYPLANSERYTEEGDEVYG